MKLVSWNVNGIRAIHRKGDLVETIQALKPDILCLQETKAEQHQSEVDLPDYEEYWNSSKGRKGYSGTAIFTKEKPLAILFDFPTDIVNKYGLGRDGYGDPNAEGRVLAAEFNEFYVVNCYTPNSKPDLSRLALRHKHWDPGFTAYCKSLQHKKPVIICGDLNVAHTPDDLANPKQNEGEHGYTQEERDGFTNLLNIGLVDVYRSRHKGNGHYTWWSNFSNARTRNIGWRIDYFLVSETILNRVTASHIHADRYGSDHCPISIEFISA